MSSYSSRTASTLSLERKFFYNYRLQAVMVETDDNYKIRYVVCPLEVLHLVFFRSLLVWGGLFTLSHIEHILTALSGMQNKDAFPYLEVVDPEYPQ